MSAAVTPVTIGALFSGIGGLELGLEWAGLGPTVFQCEIDPFCRAVLASPWPHVERFVDVTQPRSYPHVDLICGGFPCQDVSSAGKRRGIGGAKSGLWYHFARVVRQARPRFVVVENVASGAKAWLPHVQRDLARLGYRTRALGIAAADVGAPHLRRRIFVVAHAHGVAPGGASRSKGAPNPADPNGAELWLEPGRRGRATGRRETEPQVDGATGEATHAHRLAVGLEREGETLLRGAWNGGRDGRSPVSAVRGVDDGVPPGMDARRKRALGNAVVPQCAQIVGEGRHADDREVVVVSAAVSHHPPLAKGGKAIAICPVVFVDRIGTAHWPDGKGKLTRCGKISLSRLERCAWEPDDRICPGCEGNETTGTRRRGR